MKKIFPLIGAFALMAVVGLPACDDNDDVCNPHVLTDDEIAEIARQDSVRKAQLAKVDADLILEYTVEDYVSSTWTSKSLEIDLAKIGELFGLTAAEVKAGINQEDGAPEITGFAIQGTNHSDYNEATTTNGAWGHWWNKDGDACKWADGNLAFYCEWQDDYFAVGQNPGGMAEGDTYTFYECLKYGDKRVAVKITFSIVARGEVTAKLISTYTYDTEFAVSTKDYAGSSVTVDLDKILADLGITDRTQISIIGFNEDGSYAQEHTSNSAFWYNASGYPDSYSNGATYIEYFVADAEIDEGDDVTVYIGQMPNALEAGKTFTISIGLLSGAKIVRLDFNVTTLEGEAPVEITGEIVSTLEYELSAKVDTNYATTSVTIESDKILTALGAESFDDVTVFGFNADGTYTTDLTADFGFWYDKDGNPCSWGDTAFAFMNYLGISSGDDKDLNAIAVGQYPKATAAGDTATLPIGFFANDKQVKVVVKLTITE